MNLNLIITLVLFSTIFLSCNKKQEEASDNETGLIEITKAQFDSENMELGEPGQYPFYNLVRFTGTIVPSVMGQAQISLPLPGLISKIYCQPAQNVNKGTLLFEVSGNEFIDIQKDFAESSAVLKRLKSEYERMKELRNENIGTSKEFIHAESAFFAEQAKCNALKIKLNNMGLNTSHIEKGTIFSTYLIKSQINGYVSSIDATIGQFIDPQQKIAEIIDSRAYQLKLSVFEKDINKVKTGQIVNYFINNNKSAPYFAKISSVGKTIMNDTKSIDCYAEIKNLDKTKLVSNQYTEGEIVIASDSVLSVPQSAIIQSENEAYVLMLEKSNDESYYFSKIKVNTGRKNNSFVELLDSPPSNKLLIKGTYNLQIE